MSKMKYPPCSMNPMTEKPYSRHHWIIKDALRVKQSGTGELVYYYRVVCKRCGLNDPRAPTH